MRRAGRPLHPDEAEPPLGWESTVVMLYLTLQSQWRWSVGPAGEPRREGLDLNPFIALIKELRWPLDSTLMLLQVIEHARLKADRER